MALAALGQFPLNNAVLDGHRTGHFSGPIRRQVASRRLCVGERYGVVHEHLHKFLSHGDETVLGAAIDMDMRKFFFGDLEEELKGVIGDKDMS